MVTAAQPTVVLQGITAPGVEVNPNAFFPATRRMRYQMQSLANISGLGSTDSVTLRKSGIISQLLIRVTGSLVFGGTITGTTMSYRWPYDLVRACRVSANGQANLVNVPGRILKAVQFMRPGITDEGVGRTFGALTAQNVGTMAMSADDWGTSGANQLGPGATVPATGTYTVDLYYVVPVAFDQRTLLGAVFAQTDATNLTLDIDWETQANLVTLGGSATLTTPPALQWQVLGTVYTIPQVGGRFVVPDLSAFHQLVSSRTTALGQGDNEVLLPGTGIGRQLMRVIYQVYTGTAPGTPLAMTATNYGQQAWRYGGNDTPESYVNGSQLRALNEDLFSVDFGKLWGFGIHDFAGEWALRDSVDEGSTSDLRFLTNLVASPTTPACEFAQQTIFAAPVGA